MKITIGIPAYNEEKNIALIITKIKKITDSIIVCDDGSSDLTGEIARGSRDFKQSVSCLEYGRC